VSDNGTQFTSHELKEFCKTNAINHILSPPYHPQSNGWAEPFVDTFKRGLHKLQGEGSMDEILDTFLLTYRTTPNSTLPQQPSPPELFLGRKPRTSLDLLLPPKQPTGRDTKMERQFNRKHGAVTRGFEVKDQVYVRHHHSQDWKAASVRKQVGGRLYEVTLTDGSTHRFHVNQMRPRATHWTEDHFADFLTGFELPVPRTQTAREGIGPADERTADEN